MSEAITVEGLQQRGVLTEVDVLFARALGRLAGEAEESVLAAAALCNRAPRFGHIAMDLNDPERGIRLEEVVEAPVWPDAGDWRPRLARSALVAAPAGSTSPLVLEGTRLYLRRYYEHQQALASALQTLAARRVQAAAPLAADDPLLEGANPRQRAAIQAALGSTLSIITGGPGTGKTWLVVRILAALLRQDPTLRIRLLAPTGKAAARLGESVLAGVGALSDAPAIVEAVPTEASTIHSALGVKGGHLARFWRNQRNPLDTECVVIDEASMVDLVLMRRVVDALPAGARLILLGDRHQLASVEAGAVLADLCQAASDHPGSRWAGCVTTLVQSHRFDPGGPVGRLAAAVLAGDDDEAMRVLRGGGEQVRWLPPAPAGLSPEARAAVADALAGREAAVRSGDSAAMLAAESSFRILCAHRRGRLGVAGLNWTAAETLGVARAGQDRWYPGRPVLITQNDHEQRLYNGDIGVTQPAADDGTLSVAFPDGRHINANRLPPCETVFAMTIHKSQGSEFDHVMVVIPDGSRLCTRELLYTAITRARTRVSIVASEAAVRASIAERVQRIAGLQAMLGRSAS